MKTSETREIFPSAQRIRGGIFFQLRITEKLSLISADGEIIASNHFSSFSEPFASSAPSKAPYTSFFVEAVEWLSLEKRETVAEDKNNDDQQNETESFLASGKAPAGGEKSLGFGCALACVPTLITDDDNVTETLSVQSN